MTRFRRGVVLAVLLCLPARGRADDASVKALSGHLRTLVLKFLPDPLYEDTKHWGGQKDVANGITWRGKGLKVHPEVQYKAKNHGTWWKVRVTTPDRGDSLMLDLSEIQQPESGRLTFTAFFALNTDVDYERQIWDEGLRLYSGSVRARMRVMLTLRCEATARLEAKEKVPPDMVFRLRVVSSDVRYDDLVFAHVPGLGGEAAKVIGEAARASVKLWHPSLERKLLEKANAAVLKGGDTKEVRVSLSKLLGGARATP
jgi:hypothetical protein